MGLVEAKEGDTAAWIEGWSLRHASGAYDTVIEAEDFALRLHMVETQSVLINGTAGVSRKGPDAQAASYYYSLPHLAVTGEISRKGSKSKVNRRSLVRHTNGPASTWTPKPSVGTGSVSIWMTASALMAFVIRDAKGGQHWARWHLSRPYPVTPRPSSLRTWHLPPERNWTSPPHPASSIRCNGKYARDRERGASNLCWMIRKMTPVCRRVPSTGRVPCEHYKTGAWSGADIWS